MKSKHDTALELAENIVRKGGMPPSDGVLLLAEALIISQWHFASLQAFAGEIAEYLETLSPAVSAALKERATREYFWPEGGLQCPI